MTPSLISPLLLLSTKAGYLVRTAWPQTGDVLVNGVGEATLQLGDHPIAQQLRDLGVGSYPSLAGYWTPHMQVCTALP